MLGLSSQMYSLLTTHYSLLTTHYSLLTAHCSLLTAHYSLLTTVCTPLYCIHIRLVADEVMTAPAARASLLVKDLLMRCVGDGQYVCAIALVSSIVRQAKPIHSCASCACGSGVIFNWAGSSCSQVYDVTQPCVLSPTSSQSLGSSQLAFIAPPQQRSLAADQATPCPHAATSAWQLLTMQDPA